MTKRLLLPITFLMLWFCAAAQITINSLPLPEVGDTIERFLAVNANNVEITAPGGDQMWNWELNDSLRLVYRAEANDLSGVFPNADIALTDGIRHYYIAASTDAWNIEGLVGSDPIGFGLTVTSVYSPPLPDVYAPLGFSDTTYSNTTVYTGIPKSIIPDSLLAMLPVVPDSLRAAISYQQDDIVDAWGQLTLNGTDNQVLRQYRRTRFAARIEAKISILPWTDVTGFIEDFLPGGISLTDTLYEYRFLNETYGWPVAVVTVDNSNNPLRVEYSNEITLGLFGPANEVAQLEVYPNPSTGPVYINTPDYLHELISIHVFDSNGRLVLMKDAYPLNGRLVLNFDALPPGMKFIRLTSQKGHVIGLASLITAGRN